MSAFDIFTAAPPSRSLLIIMIAKYGDEEAFDIFTGATFKSFILMVTIAKDGDDDEDDGDD